jgi:hypothetical protein
MGLTGHKLVLTCVKKAMGLYATATSLSEGTPTKRQVSKRQVSKRPVSKNLYIFCTCGWWKSAGSVAAMFAGCFSFSILEVFLPYITIIASNK